MVALMKNAHGMERLLLAALVSGLMFLGAAGCGQKPDTSNTTGASASGDAASTRGSKDMTANDVLKAMAKAYRKATTYQDVGTLALRFEQNGQKVDQKIDFSVAFERPNKLRLDAYNISMRNDGKKVRGFVRHENVAGQVLELDAPETLSVQNSIVDETMLQILQSGEGAAPPSLLLLLADNGDEIIKEGASAPVLLPAKKYEDFKCHRVRLDTEQGSLTLWIDDESFLLRRLDFPTLAFQKQLEEKGAVSGLEHYAEFTGAKLNELVPAEAFAMEVPQDAKIVKRLLGPAPSPPNKLLGQKLPEFSFKTIDGKTIDREAFKDKVVVLDFWFTECTPCRESFPLVNKVYQKYKDSEKVVFLAVNADPDTLSDQTVRDTMSAWGSQVPLARDPKQDIRNAFSVDSMPVLFVVGADGTMEYQELGFNPNLEQDLPGAIEALLSGKSLHVETRKRFEQRIAEFEQYLQTPPDIAAANGEQVEIPRAKIADRSEPSKNRLTRLWSNTEIKAPGNLYVVEASEGATEAAPRIVVFDGLYTLVELDGEGKVVSWHEPGLGDDHPMAMLRTGVDKEGKRYYAGFSGQQHVYVFDDQWKHLLTFPKTEDGRHEGISDVQFVDLEGDGTLKLAVGYWRELGVQYVSFAGERLWTNRTPEVVFALAASNANESGHRQLLCNTGRGTLAPFDRQGTPGADIQVTGRPLRTIHAADLDGDGQQEYCGMALAQIGDNRLVGVDLTGKELWSYDLPSGVPERAVESVSTARLFGEERQWLVAGPDGSVHILDREGKLVDRFNSGASLSGIAGIRLNGEPVILVSTQHGVEAWKLEPSGETLATPLGATRQ